ncbi:TetR/AcrR family transcriptional regulator [Humidisolicoccus flavus]|uniref:TetR/AcrR family transcriptional regulator n=1 Tax=Humidisolicoccus flavus TaxID=3111414 RepID=UPI00325332F8
MTRAPDPRPARTRASILAAVEALTQREAEVTIANIVAEAGVARATFYTHFRDLDDVVMAVLTRAFEAIETLDLELRKTLSPLETARTTTRMLVAEFVTRRELYASLLRGTSRGQVLTAMHRAFASQALETMQATVPESLDPQTAADYVAGGSIAVLSAWLSSERPITPDHLQVQLLALLPAWLLTDEGHYERNAQ